MLIAIKASTTPLLIKGTSPVKHAAAVDLELVSKHTGQPNTTIHYPVYTEHAKPMPEGQLKVDGWRKLMTRYQDLMVVDAILGICCFGARIRYIGHRNSITIYENLTTATISPSLLSADIAHEMKKNRLNCYRCYEVLPDQFTGSPLGLTDKAVGTKRRIHHLSFQPDNPTSTNGGIPEE